MLCDTDYVKEVYENDSIVNYYNEIVDSFGIMVSEKLVFEKYVDLNHKILDIGCGAGRTTIGLKKLGYNSIVGIDISENMILKARSNDPSLQFIISSVLNLPFNDNTFDVAFFSFNGLMLIPDIVNRRKAMIEIRRILKSEGIFIFSTPYLDNKLEKPFWKERLKSADLENSDIELGDLFIDDMGVKDIYIHMPFIQEIKDMLNETGYTIVEYKPRTDIYIESEEIENELDDNLYWIVRSN